MGRLKKLRIEATKKANEAIADRQKREIRAQKEVDNTETARNATKDDVFGIIGIERAKSRPGLLQQLQESAAKIKENKDAKKTKKSQSEKKEMDEALRQMKYLVDYDTSKTREENQSIDELHIFDPEGWDDDFKKAQEKRKDGPNYKGNVPPYEKPSKEELRKAILAKQRAEAGLESDEPTFSMPVVDVSGTDRGAAKDKEVHKSQCCDANAIKYSSKGVKGDIDTHYTCTNCGKISSEPKTKEEVNELFGMFDSHAEKNWKESIEKVIENFFGGDVPESTGQRKYLEDIWDEANEKYDREEGESTSIDVAEIVRKILSGKTKMRKEGTYGRTIDKIIRLANTIKKQKEEENAL